LDIWVLRPTTGNQRFRHVLLKCQTRVLPTATPIWGVPWLHSCFFWACSSAKVSVVKPALIGEATGHGEEVLSGFLAVRAPAGLNMVPSMSRQWDNLKLHPCKPSGITCFFGCTKLHPSKACCSGLWSPSLRTYASVGRWR
jgi:hypothetical protein